MLDFVETLRFQVLAILLFRLFLLNMRRDKTAPFLTIHMSVVNTAST